MLSAIQRTMLDIALRPSSNDEEAATALRKLRQRLPTGFSVDDLMGQQDWQDEAAALSDEVAHLTSEVARLKMQLGGQVIELREVKRERDALKTVLKQARSTGAVKNAKARATRARAAEWNDKEIAHLRKLIKAGQTQAEVAAVLSRKFKRSISQPAVSRMVAKLRAEGRW